MKALIQSDAYVVVAPTYFLGAHASLKHFLDRGLSFYDHVDELWGKPAVGVAIAGNKGMEGYTKLAVENFIKLSMGDLRGSAVIYGALPGEIFIGDKGKETAKRLAKALMYGRENNLDIPACPLCRGDSFRFLPDGQVRCLLCSNTGFYEWKENHLQCQITLGEHPWFLGYESSKQHNDLIREKKKDFLSRRKELKEIAQQYTQEVTWIRSARSENNK
jgi:multimeric flavodoxin WrbA